MRRTTRRGGSRQQNHHHNNRYNIDDDNITLKPLNDQPRINENHREPHQQQPNNEASHSSSAASTSSLHQPPRNPNKPHRNPKWASRNLRKNTSSSSSKQWSVKKPDLHTSEFPNSEEAGPPVTKSVSYENLEVVSPKSGTCLDSEVGSLCSTEKVGGNNEEGDMELNEGGSDGRDDVMRRLQQLQLGVEDPELSAEQLRINDQLQEDELLAMESIYGENVVFLDSHKGLRCFQMHIQIADPRGLNVIAKLNTFRDIDKSNGSSNDFSYSFKVHYLPPVVLTCLLPKAYPSHAPPHFTLLVKWLDSSRISTLCSMLDSIWMQISGQEVIYQWTEWLQNFCLSFLGIDDEIILGPYDRKHTGDRRAVSGLVSPDIDVPSLKSYNDEQTHENFCQSMHECCICCDEYAGSDFVKLPCQHFFCSTCMKTFSNIHIKEGTVNKLQCPDAKCGGMVPPSVLKQLLGDKDYERWESLLLQKTLESMSDVQYCPRCETPCIADEDQHAQCSKCLFSFCTICWQRRHIGEACLTPELRLQILEGRQNSSLLKGEQKRKEQDMINEILSVKEILSFAKQCPTCKMAISRTAGCNKMVCENCRQYFCYRCNSAIDGYDHFRDGECELFPEDALREWEQQMNGNQVVMVAQQQGGIPVLCPFCGQANAKVNNNNHMYCWACRRHYCYLCKQIVRRSAQHFGPKGCRQHTEG